MDRGPDLSVVTRIDGQSFAEFDGRRKGEFDRRLAWGDPASSTKLEGEIVIAQCRGVRDPAPISSQRAGEVECAVNDFGGASGDGIILGAHASGCVAEQEGVLGDEGDSRYVDGVVERVEDGEFWCVQEIHEREICSAAATRAAPARRALVAVVGWLHRFLLPARLAVDAATWNTSKYNFSSSWDRLRSAAATSNSSAMFIMTR